MRNNFARRVKRIFQDHYWTKTIRIKVTCPLSEGNWMKLVLFLIIVHGNLLVVCVRVGFQGSSFIFALFPTINFAEVSGMQLLTLV